MTPRSGDGKRAGTTVRVNAEMLRDAYLVALGRQTLRSPKEPRSHRSANVGIKAGATKPLGKVR